MQIQLQYSCIRMPYCRFPKRRGAIPFLFLLLLLQGLLVLLPIVSSSSPPTSTIVPQKKHFLSCNWKGSLETTNEVDSLVDDLNRMWRHQLTPAQKEAVLLCVHPPYCFLDRVRSKLDSAIEVGSQNVLDATAPSGPLSGPSPNTGSTTPKMLKAVGCDWVLLGHSDRRNNLGETDPLIGDKIRQSLDVGDGKDGLKVTLTIGELAWQRRWGRALPTLRKQLNALIQNVHHPDEWDRIVVAYEPVWAVGDGAVPCSPQEAQRVHAALRAFLTKQVGAEAAQKCRFVYTGSVNEDNAAAYAPLQDVQGFVVGRAGLDTTKLRSILVALAEN